MSQNQDSERRAAIASSTAKNDRHETADPQWEQLVLELRASCNNAPEDLDEIAVARYLSGECSEQERREIEQIIGQSSDLTDCVALAQEVLKEKEAAA